MITTWIYSHQSEIISRQNQFLITCNISENPPLTISVSLIFLGVLMKRSTCLYATKDRLRLMQQFLQKVS